MRYRVDIREVWISTREVEMPEGTTNHKIIQAALDEDDEVEFEYSHTLDSENHTVEKIT